MKRAGTLRVRNQGLVHVVRARRPVHASSDQFYGTTICGQTFRHATLPDDTVVTCMMCVAREEN